MTRREFITLLGGAAAWPLASRAQTTQKIYRLGALSPATAQLDSVRSIVLPELAKAGIAEGRNLILDARAGSMEQLPGLARDLIATNPDAVMAVSGAAIGALKAASKTVPIVMSMSDYDPVAAGFAESFARPGGNITGIAMFATVLDAKRLQLLHEALPAARRIAVLAVSERRHEMTLAAMAVTASAEGIELAPVYAEGPASYPRAFTAMRAAAAQALVIVAAPEFNRDAENSRCPGHRRRVADDVRMGPDGRARLPAGLRPSRARSVAARRRLRAAGSARRGASHTPDRGAGAFRVRREPENRPAARSDHSHLGAATRRSAHRMTCCLLHCMKSGIVQMLWGGRRR